MGYLQVVKLEKYDNPCIKITTTVKLDVIESCYFKRSKLYVT